MQAVGTQEGENHEERRDLALRAAIEGVSAAFASLGRVFLCVDAGFQVLHASSLLDRLIGRGAAATARGRPVAELLGAELFGPSGTMRQLLLAGERREGWRSMLTVAGTKPRLVSLTAAPFHSDPGSVCDPRVAYILVLRPAEEDEAAAGAPNKIGIRFMLRNPKGPSQDSRKDLVRRLLRLLRHPHRSRIAAHLSTSTAPTG